MMKLLSLIYGFIVFIRNGLYDLKIKKSIKVDGVEIICIGNIVAGGSGKTPAVQYFAEKYMKEGKKTGILSRGYKGEREKDPFLVRDENKILANPSQSGDEAYLHALNLKVPVVVSRNRVEGAKFLKEKFNVDVIVMDDGFQHRKLVKDKNIVLIDATNPFGGQEYLPKGRLRESPESLKRADMLIISKSNYVTEKELNDIEEKIKKYGKKTLVAIFKEEGFYDTDEEIKPLSEIENKSVLIFSSIANPEVFYKTIEKLNPKSIKELKFEDHHKYTEDEILNIEKEGKNFNYIITTEKDIVKIDKKIKKLLILKMKFEIVKNLIYAI